jgi:anti-sigma B factor antagonist
MPSTAVSLGHPISRYSLKRERPLGSAGMGTQDDYRISVLRRADGLVVVEASGAIDIAGSFDFRERLFALLDERAARMVVDLSSVDYVDTSALSALLDVAKRCRLEDCRLAIVCSEGGMRRALAATGLDQFVATHATLDEALARDDPAP